MEAGYFVGRVTGILRTIQMAEKIRHIRSRSVPLLTEMQEKGCRLFSP
jgi:hypothetical protein